MAAGDKRGDSPRTAGTSPPHPLEAFLGKMRLEQPRERRPRPYPAKRGIEHWAEPLKVHVASTRTFSSRPPFFEFSRI